MTKDDEISVIRTGAGVTRGAHVARVRCTGQGALGVLSRMSTRRLFLRDGQMSHTLFLREDGRPIADAYIGSGEDGAYYVLAEGLTEPELIALAERVRDDHTPGADAVFEGLSGEFELLSVNGPYAWEVMAAACGPAVLGMPYLTLMHLEHGICFRAGKTGEYGYDILVSREALGTFEARLRAEDSPLGLSSVGVAALDQCALENWHYNVRAMRDTPLATPLTPLELQLQWRVSYKSEFVGAEALRARRAQGIAVRLVCFSADGPVASGDALRLGDRVVGEVFVSGWSPTANRWVGTALVVTALSYPGIHSFRAGARRTALSTRTPPIVNNRSLYVDPHRHSYRTRDKDSFPQLIVGS